MHCDSSLISSVFKPRIIRSAIKLLTISGKRAWKAQDPSHSRQNQPDPCWAGSLAPTVTFQEHHWHLRVQESQQRRCPQPAMRDRSRGRQVRIQESEAGCTESIFSAPESCEPLQRLGPANRSRLWRELAVSVRTQRAVSLKREGTYCVQAQKVTRH